ncbi:hypothetical protein, partial [Agathobacter rectalis]|uniref:hypothetical protein n=1 Tax=Agathobacter rectalis TaxID=39491 RepID=UPI0027D27283
MDEGIENQEEDEQCRNEEQDEVFRDDLYENAVESVQKLSREAELYTMNYLASEETDSLADTAVPIASYLA